MAPLWKQFFPFQCHNLESYLALPLRILLLVGLGNYGHRDKKLGYYAYFAYTILIVLFFLFSFILMLYATDWTDGILDYSAACFLAMASTSIRLMMISITIIHSSRKGRFEKLISTWKEYKLDESISPSDKKRAKWKITIVFFFFLTFLLLAIIQSILPKYFPNQPIARTRVPAEDVKIIESGIFTVGSIIVHLVLFTPHYALFIITIHLTSVWRAFGNSIKKMPIFDELLEYTMVKHKELTQVVRQINRTFGSFILVMFATDIPNVLSVLYVLTFAKCWGPIGQISLGTWFASIIFSMAILASPFTIYDAAEAIYEKFYARYHQFLLQQKSTGQANLNAESAIILDHLRGAKVGVSPFGFFMIKKSFIMGVISIMVTYYVTMCQFVYQPNSSVACAGRNVTNGTDL